MATGTLIYEGKAKKIYTTGHPDEVLQYFKDDATAFNAQKRGTIVEKGIINNKVSERLFRLLEQSGVPTHFVERKSDREMLTKKVTIVPVEVVVRNVVAGSLAKRLGLKEGDRIHPPIVEWYYKNDALGDPLVADDHVRLLKLATPEQLTEIRRLALKVNGVLQPFFAERRMWQFVLAIEGLKDTCEHFNIPIVSGNVSFYNETNGLSIYPTPMLGMVGLIEEAARAMTQWFRDDGDAIVLLGQTRDDLGGSEYLKVLQHREQGSPPLLNLDTEKALHAFALKVIHGAIGRSGPVARTGGRDGPEIPTAEIGREH